MKLPAKYMNLKNPVGSTIKFNNQNFKVIGVIKDMVMESPYDPVRRTIYMMDENNVTWIELKLNPNKKRLSESIVPKVETVFKKYVPDAPFEYKFADAEFAAKFAAETRIGQLSTFFAVLAIFASVTLGPLWFSLLRRRTAYKRRWCA